MERSSWAKIDSGSVFTVFDLQRASPTQPQQLLAKESRQATLIQPSLTVLFVVERGFM